MVPQGVEGVVNADGEELRGVSVVLATGHSARDVLAMLQRENIALEAKAFAVGVRIEHPQPLIDSIQYHYSARDKSVRGNCLPRVMRWRARLTGAGCIPFVCVRVALSCRRRLRMMRWWSME